MGTFGVVYVCAGEVGRRRLPASIATTRRNLPRCSIHVVADVAPRTADDAPSAVACEPARLRTRLIDASPFDVSLCLDASLSLSARSGTFDDLLANHDVVVAGPPARGRSVVPAPDPEKTIPSSEPDTSVLLFRKGVVCAQFFKYWHTEWTDCGGSDGGAFLRAAQATPGLRYRVLPPGMGLTCPADVECLPVSLRSEQWRAALSFIDTRTPAERDQIHWAYLRAATEGLCSATQYLALARLVDRLRPMNLLVFGCGADSRLWSQLNRGGRTTFVESNPRFVNWGRRAGLDVIHSSFPTRVGAPASGNVTVIPHWAGTIRWDMAFIDGPPGHEPTTPGRELPILWTSLFRPRPLVALHDSQRPWESWCARRYLGTSDACVSGRDTGHGDLSFWMCGKADRSVVEV